MIVSGRFLVTAVLLVSACALSHAAENGNGPARLSELNSDFESGTLEGWTVVSGNLGKQPSSIDDDRQRGNFNKNGRYFIGTLEDGDKHLGDYPTGEIRSPAFLVDCAAIAFRVGGGDDFTRLYVALCDAGSGMEIQSASGKGYEAMADVVWDLSRFKNRLLYMKIVDNAIGGWGHINVDYFRGIGQAEYDGMERSRREENERIRLAEEPVRRRWAETIAAYLETVFDPASRKVYRGPDLPNVWMPLGGIGAGGMAIAGTGEFRRWMTHGILSHNIFDGRPIEVPDAFFAVRAAAGGSPSTARLLKAGTNGFSDVEFYGEFPIAFHRFADPAMPVQVNLESFSPFIPLDATNSGLPVAVFLVTVENLATEKTDVTLTCSLQNAVGRIVADGADGPASVDNSGYGGNTVTPARIGKLSGVTMVQAGKAGSMVLAARARAEALEPWTDRDAFWSAVSGNAAPVLKSASSPTPPGKTANAAIAVKFKLKAGEKRTVPFIWTWYLPGNPRNTHAYENWFTSAADVCSYVDRHFNRLAADTRLFHDTLFRTTLPYYVTERLSSQCSTLFTRVVSWTKDDNVYGWEGLGCCNGSCTHVWNYEQTMAHLFPSLERRMRDINLGPGMAPDGAVFNRYGAPDAPWGLQGVTFNAPINEGPAADGHASTLSKTYREWRLSPDDEWLKKHYPAVKLAMEFWIRNWDGQDEDGVARGRQFNTYDTSLAGANTFIGSQYLAALRAAGEMATIAGDDDSARRWRGIFNRGSAAYVEECWDDEYKYFVQFVTPGKRAADYGNACFVDQLLGQWWALVNDLGYVFPRQKVDAALAAIARWNMIGDASLFKPHYSTPRSFIWGRGKGLVNCAWPRGDYISDPISYREEVWSGCEYQAAASMIWEGLLKEGLAVVKAINERYNDGLRCPWNEVESGDHYARAMSSWSVLLACQGFSYIGPRGKIGFDPRLAPDNHQSFFSAAEGWGSFTQRRGERRQDCGLAVVWGRVRIAELSLGLPAGVATPQVEVELDGSRIRASHLIDGDKLKITLDRPVVLPAGEALQVTVKW
ncbi:MAG: GH116 family glycosyl-hydrolase [bacterium]